MKPSKTYMNFVRVREQFIREHPQEVEPAVPDNTTLDTAEKPATSYAPLDKNVTAAKDSSGSDGRSAANRAVHVSEISEGILKLLPTCDLIQAMCISKTWRNVILGSKVLLNRVLHGSPECGREKCVCKYRDEIRDDFVFRVKGQNAALFIVRSRRMVLETVVLYAEDEDARTVKSRRIMPEQPKGKEWSVGWFCESDGSKLWEEPADWSDPYLGRYLCMHYSDPED